MSEPTPVKLIEDSLNDVLIRMNDTEDTRRELERDLNLVRTRLEELDRESRGLRLALFALAGDVDPKFNAAEANSQNLKQRQELRRART